MPEGLATRRHVLGCGLAGCAAVAGLAGCSATAASGRPSTRGSSPSTTSATPSVSATPDLAALAAVPAKDALAVTDPDGKPGFLVRNGATVVYLSAVCSHGGCTVAWDAGKGRFVCPCHLSEFDRTGRVLNPPAPGPLTRKPVKVVDGQVLLAGPA